MNAETERHLKERIKVYLAYAYTEIFAEPIEVAKARVEKMEQSFLRAIKDGQ